MLVQLDLRQRGAAARAPRLEAAPAAGAVAWATRRKLARAGSRQTARHGAGSCRGGLSQGARTWQHWGPSELVLERFPPPRLRCLVPGAPARRSRSAARAPCSSSRRDGRDGCRSSRATARSARGISTSVAVRRVLEAKERFDRILSRQAIIVDSIERHSTLSPRAARAHPRDLRPRRARGPLPPLPAAEEEPRAGRARGGPAAARRLDLGLRPRDRPAAGGPDARAVGLHLPQRGEGDRRRQGRDRGRARHPRRAAGRRRRSCGRSCGAPTSRQGFVRATKTREGEAALEVRELLRLPGAGRARCASRRARTATSRCGAASRRASCRSPIGGAARGRRVRGAARREPSRRRPARVPDSPGAEVLRHAGRIAFKNNVRTSIENEVHRVLKDAADAAAAQVFAENVKRLLREPPFGPKPVLGVDPGIRTGCKLVDRGRRRGVHRQRGRASCRRTSRRRPPPRRCCASPASAASLPWRSANGAGGREAEVFARAALRQPGLELPVVLVSEAGASVYAHERGGPGRVPRPRRHACAGRSRSPAGCRTRSRSW